MSSSVNENASTLVVFNHGPVIEAEVIPDEKCWIKIINC
jgi:hypothetical protein